MIDSLNCLFFLMLRIGESGIADVPIQAGDPVFGYVVTVRVRVFDIYGDYGTFTKNITVRVCFLLSQLLCDFIFFWQFISLLQF